MKTRSSEATTPADPTEPNRLPSPRGSTIADLLVMTLGVALAVSLEWYSGAWLAIAVAGSPTPTWPIVLNRVIEACQKGCIALIPIVLFRRRRHGGMIRPAEALPIFIGLPQVLFSISKSAFLGIYNFDHLSSQFRLVSIEALNLWLLAEIALGVLAVALASLRRRRPPDWITGVLIVFGYSRITEAGGFFFQQWANERIGTASHSLATGLLCSAFLVQWPLVTLGFVPLAAAVLDFGRSSLPGRSGPEWGGMLVGGSTLALIQVRIAFQEYLGSRHPFGFGNSRHLMILVAAIVASFWLVHSFGPVLRRFCFDRYRSNQTNPISPPAIRAEQTHRSPATSPGPPG